MKKITVLSGKGGVGKSSVTASLAVLLSREKKIVAVDCDVDASNLSLILGIEKMEKETQISTNYKSFLDEKKCVSCKKCLDICAFSAIEWDEEKNIPKVNKFLCEGCGTCQLICPNSAFSLKKVKNAVMSEAKTEYGFPIISGQLKMGESGSGKIVDLIKEEAEKTNAEIMLIDSAAGIGCPVIASVRESDYIVAVTEPTPSALSDMKRALQIVEHFSIPYSIIINRWDLNKEFTKKIEEFAQRNNIPVIGKIGYDKKFIEALVNLKPVVVYEKNYEKLFSSILDKIPLD